MINHRIRTLNEINHLNQDKTVTREVTTNIQHRMNKHRKHKGRGKELTKGPRWRLEEEAEVADDHGGTGSTPRGVLRPIHHHNGDHDHA